MTDPFARARKVADAVLYEGYVLYPYRASSRKNQIRWQFGVVAPRQYAETDPSEDWAMQTEVLLDAGMDAELDVKIRFLRVQERQVQRVTDDGTFVRVDELDVATTLLTSWDEAVEQEVNVSKVSLSSALMGERVVPIELDPSEELELVHDGAGGVAGRVLRRRQPVSGAVRISAEAVPGPYSLVKVRVRVENLSPWPGLHGPNGVEVTTNRDDVCRRSLAAVHTLIAARDGAFISLADPPEFAAAAAKSCVNSHTWPVMVGDPGSKDAVVLSSPVTLSDYPEIAPESPGDMFDACEIDEILALRVMTLTDDEKREARSTDPRAAAIIDRCDIMPEEIFERLHGVVRYMRDAGGVAASDAGLRGPNADAGLRGPNAVADLRGPNAVAGLRGPNAVAGVAEGDQLDPWWDVDADREGPAAPKRPDAPWWTPDAEAEVDPFSDRVWVGAVSVGPGSRVVLRPSRRADAHDLFLAGRPATVQAVFQDVDGNTHVAVSILDDAGAEYQLGHGRYLFFYPDEVEPVADEPADAP